MQETSRVVIPANNVRSLCWRGDELINWVGGGIRYRLDGTSTLRSVNYAYGFDRAVTSANGQYAVIYEVLGTKGLVLKDGKILREINRSFYHACVYEYPIVLFDPPGRRTMLAHCPDRYNKIEIEDAETGERLTARESEPVDFFQSRLTVSPDGKHLMSAGWIWHPFDYVLLFNIAEVLVHPELLNAPPNWSLAATGTEIANAVFADFDTVLFTSADAYYDVNDEEERSKLILRPDQLGHYSLSEERFLTIVPLTELLGTLMPIEKFTVSFYKHPKLVEIATGEIVHRWPDLETGSQNGSISQNLDKLPPLALDPANKRFAVADDEKITIIQLG